MMSEELQTIRQYGQLVIAFNLPTQWRRGGKWGYAPRGAVLRGASTHLIQPFINAILSRNRLDQKLA